MNRDFFNKQFAALLSVYTYAQKMPDVGQEIYWEMLQDISEEDFADGVKICLGSCKFFPTIDELGEASMPDIPDKKAPLPPVDHERPKINWQVQLERAKQERQKQLEKEKQRKLLQGGSPMK